MCTKYNRIIKGGKKKYKLLTDEESDISNEKSQNLNGSYDLENEDTYEYEDEYQYYSEDEIDYDPRNEYNYKKSRSHSQKQKSSGKTNKSNYSANITDSNLKRESLSRYCKKKSPYQS